MDMLALHNANGDFKSFWKCTNKLNIKSSIPVSIGGISEPKAIANLFKNRFLLKSPLGLPCREYDTEPMLDEELALVSSSVFRKLITKMRGGKSPGLDGLSIEHLRYAGYHLPRVLSLLYNLCLSHSYLPPDLMRTVVVPVIKNKIGDVSDSSNYRPISLATIIAKLFDSILNAELYDHVALHDAQFGFRQDLSTEAAIFSLKNTVKYYTDRQTPIYACFLDLSKAFDLVAYDTLWFKLQETGLPSQHIHLLKWWYLNQQNLVRWVGEYSEPCRLECGVRQGGLSSPLLFNLYINKLIERLSSIHVGCYINDICINNISYADDMVLLAPSIGALRKLVSVCEEYATTHGLLYNVNKSEFMVFKSGSKCPSFVPPIYLNGTSLGRVYKYKYLGHLVTDDLRDEEDMERERRALCVRANMLARRFARCTEAIKVILFKAYCTSLYSGSLWFNFTQKTYNALRIQYNNAFRVLMRLPRYCSASAMFADARTDGFDAIWRKKTASLLRRVRGSSNSILLASCSDYGSPLLRVLTQRTKALALLEIK